MEEKKEMGRMSDEAEGNLRRTVLQGPRGRREHFFFWRGAQRKPDWATLIPIWLKHPILTKVAKLGQEMHRRADASPRIQVMLKLLSGKLKNM